MRKKPTNSIINSPIINITGLSCRLWDDAHPETLRKRLYWKATRQTLTPDERSAILDELEDLLIQARREFNGY